MKCFVYILYSQSHDKFYIGQTDDVEIRFARHNAGTERATQPYRPWILKWHTEKPSRAKAMKLEKKLKNLTKISIKVCNCHRTDRPAETTFYR